MCLLKFGLGENMVLANRVLFNTRTPAPITKHTAFFCAGTASASQVRVWEIQRGYGTQSITAVPKAQINHDAPVLCTDFSADGTKVFSGGASKQARALRIIFSL